MDSPLQRSKYTCFDKYTLGRMHYVKDIHGNYVKKSKREPKQPELRIHDEPKQFELERQYQPKKALVEPEPN